MDLKEKAIMSQKVSNACEDPPGSLYTRMWISTSIFGMKFAVPSLLHFLTFTQGRMGAGKKERKKNCHAVTEGSVPGAPFTDPNFTASLARSCS